MRTNGLLYIKSLKSQNGAQNGFDEDGNPVRAEVAWRGPLGCSIMTNSDTRKGVYEDGLFRSASFTVLLESGDLPCRKADEVRLVRDGEVLGEYFVLSVELLGTVGRIKIVV